MSKDKLHVAMSDPGGFGGLGSFGHSACKKSPWLDIIPCGHVLQHLQKAVLLVSNCILHKCMSSV